MNKAEIKLSIIVPSVNGEIPAGLPSDNPCVEIVVIKGVTPVSAARNEGLRRAIGKYIAWVDSDDSVTEEWLPSILSALNKDADVISFCARVKWLDVPRPDYFVGGIPKVEDVMSERVNGQLWNKVIRRNLYQGLSFCGATHEDYRLLCELLPRAKTFVHIDKVLYVYQRGKHGVSQHLNQQEVVAALRDLIAYSHTLSLGHRKEMAKGVIQRVSDFCRNAKSYPEFRSYIRRNIAVLLSDMRIGIRVKIKAMLAAVGI